MRLLHTSDWHLGRSLHGFSLLDEQAQVVDRIVALADEAAVDLVIIAGDVFDRAVPPTEAVALFDDAVVRLRDTGARVVVIAGNHDAATRLAVGGRLTERAGVAIRGPLDALGRPVLLGEADEVAVYPIPYLEPLTASVELARTEGGDTTEDLRTLRLSQHQLMDRALARARADLARRRVAHSVVVAHTFVAGSIASASERDIAVGGVELTGAGVFDGFDYIALGHLHRPQTVAGTDRIAYAGSPLPYSFGEADDHKSVRLVELGRSGLHVEVVPLAIGTPLRTVRGTLEELLRDPQLDDAEAANLRVDLTDAVLPMHAKARLEQRFRRVLQLRHTPPETLGTDDAPSLDDVAITSPLDLAEQFALDQLGSLTELQSELLAAAVARAIGEEATA